MILAVPITSFVTLTDLLVLDQEPPAATPHRSRGLRLR
jgi:hypothetical protein